VSRYLLNKRATINGRPGVAWAVVDEMIDCYIDGERTITGEALHALWHRDLVLLHDEVGVRCAPLYRVTFEIASPGPDSVLAAVWSAMDAAGLHDGPHTALTIVPINDAARALVPPRSNSPIDVRAVVAMAIDLLRKANSAASPDPRWRSWDELSGTQQAMFIGRACDAMGIEPTAFYRAELGEKRRA
jgi:hypothetical protein